MKFSITSRDPGGSEARCGVMTTHHGRVHTPAFMPVGTQGAVKAVHPRQLRALGAEIILGNTYHLSLRPGPELVKAHGGLHRFIGWDGALLTDSGGFQIHSMQGLHKVHDKGVSFSSHINGSKHFMSPEDCVHIQHAFGSDIIMVLDHCVSYPASKEVFKKAMELTCRWARRSIEVHRREAPNQELFGIQQGGFDKALRRECADQLIALGFDGHAVGGLSVGEPKDLLMETANLCAPMFPEDKPRYLMGVGPPEDLLTMIGFGYDLFDCVLPTRNARTGLLFTTHGKLVIKHSRYRDDPRPLDPECSCEVCADFSRAYLRHLFISGEILSAMLNTHHNLHFFLKLMADARAAIEAGEFTSFREQFLKNYTSGLDDS